MTTMKTTLSALAILAIAGPALAADFTTLDVNTDGQISFEEYKSVALTEGKTITLAAQEFMRMAQGDAVITQDEFFLSEALADQPYALQPNLISQPLNLESAPVSFEPMAFVETPQTSPDATEMIEPPVVIEEVPETQEMKDVQSPVIMEKAMSIDPAVAGEVETSIESAPDGLGEEFWEDVTPMEEVEIEPSVPNLELELEDWDDESELEDATNLETLESGDIDSSEIY